MSSGAVRRAQVIAPFGVGALTVVPNGTSLIAAGLDYWFERDATGDDTQSVDVDEYRLEEWRLQAELRVSHFRLPPDWRTRKRFGGEIPNLKLPIPYQRFPTWSFCARCNQLRQDPLSARGKVQCTGLDHAGKGTGKGPFVSQVPFVAICDYGHLQDFPWREWVHRALRPTCEGTLRLRSTGGASLAAQMVECSCGRKRSLAGITEAAPVGTDGIPRTTLSSELTDDDEEYRCSGSMPWHGANGGAACGRPIRGSLRAASNLYFALVKSAIYIPRATADAPEKLILALESPPLSTLISLLRQVRDLETISPGDLRGQQRDILQPFTDAEIANALKVLANTSGSAAADEPEGEPDGDGLSDETEFRRPEFAVLREEIQSDFLEISRADLSRYDEKARRFFSRLMLIDKLRETRALYGFNRIFPESGWKLDDRKALLWKQQPEWRESWLPAYVVHGEGIFLELDEELVRDWESRVEVRARVAKLAMNYSKVQTARHLRERQITPRFVLLHTMAHLLMNQLTFECGYSSAALRERLYVADSSDRPMAAVLIYTAAGDAEGTLGGLVRMGKPGNFEPSLLTSLEAARWCSSDPVCMEIGEAGQGPDSCNMAACHSCALVPETACEEFNRFLDRALVIGAHDDPRLGFFAEP